MESLGVPFTSLFPLSKKYLRVELLSIAFVAVGLSGKHILEFFLTAFLIISNQLMIVWQGCKERRKLRLNSNKSEGRLNKNCQITSCSDFHHTCSLKKLFKQVS